MKSPTRSHSHIVHHALGVKSWLAVPPSAADARPGACSVCDAPSRPPGIRLGLHGHGVRERQLRGPPEPDAPSTTVVVICRRYRCTSCGAILLVVPRGVAPRRHYGHAAIAMALALWAIVGAPVAEVRRRVCAWQVTREAPGRWLSLRRWAASARVALGLAGFSLDAAAARAAQLAMGRAPPGVRTAPREAQAFAGGGAMP